NQRRNTSHRKCCSAQAAFTPFHPNMPLTLIFRSACGVCSQPGQQGFLFYFNVLGRRPDASESVRGHPTAVFSEVLFKQHPAENCIPECSKCLFVVACRSM